MNNSVVIVNELRNASYTNADVLKFHLNENLMLLNGKETFLRFKLTLGAKGAGTTDAGTGQTDADHWAPWFMDTQAATEALVKSIRIVERKSGAVLEEITDYNLLAKKIGSYTQNDTMENMKKLYYGADTFDVRENNTLTKRPNVPVQSSAQNNRAVEVFLRLSLSGIFGDKAPLFPIFGCPLELQITLESDSYKVVRAQSANNAQGEITAVYYGDRDNYSKSVGYSVEMAYAVDSIVAPGGAAATQGVNLDGAAIAGVARANQTAITTGAVETAATDPRTTSSENEFPFYIGQEINIRYIGQAAATEEDVSAVIDDIEVDAARLKLVFKANVDLSGGGGATGAGDAQGYIVYIKDPGSKPVINLEQVELVCPVVQPDEATIKKYEGAMTSGEGMGLPILSWYDYPVNTSAGALQVSNLINCKLRNVKGVLTWYENVSDGSVFYQDNLRTPNNTAVAPRQYVYKLDGLQVPSRAIDLTNVQRVRTAAGWWSCQHLRELKQALKECGFVPRDLSKSDLDFMIGRALTRFPNSYSLADLQGELRLDMQFTTNTKNLLFHNFVCHTKTLLISPAGVKVME